MNKSPPNTYNTYRSIDIANMLISKGANIDVMDKYGNTPLHIASECGSKDLVRHLISRGANKDAKNIDGKTAYDLAKSDEIQNILNPNIRRNRNGYSYNGYWY